MAENEELVKQIANALHQECGDECCDQFGIHHEDAMNVLPIVALAVAEARLDEHDNWCEECRLHNLDVYDAKYQLMRFAPGGDGVIRDRCSRGQGFEREIAALKEKYAQG